MIRGRNHDTGQALVEFTLVLPVILLILFASYMVGTAMYTGANASSAMRAALQNKILFADTNNAETEFESAVNGYNTGSLAITGSVVDNFSLTQQNRNVAVAVADKTVTLPLFPAMTFTVSQGVQSNLMHQNTGASNAPTFLPYSAATPQTAATLDPTTYSFDSDVPAFVPIDNTCTADFSAFDSANMIASCDGPCRHDETQRYMQDHVDLASAMSACGGAGATFKASNDVSFNTFNSQTSGGY